MASSSNLPQSPKKASFPRTATMLPATPAEQDYATAEKNVLFRLYEAPDGFRGSYDEVLAHEQGLMGSKSAGTKAVEPAEDVLFALYAAPDGFRGSYDEVLAHEQACERSAKARGNPLHWVATKTAVQSPAATAPAAPAEPEDRGWVLWLLDKLREQLETLDGHVGSAAALGNAVTEDLARDVDGFGEAAHLALKEAVVKRDLTIAKAQDDAWAVLGKTAEELGKAAESVQALAAGNEDGVIVMAVDEGTRSAGASLRDQLFDLADMADEGAARDMATLNDLASEFSEAADAVGAEVHEAADAASLASGLTKRAVERVERPPAAVGGKPGAGHVAAAAGASARGAPPASAAVPKTLDVFESDLGDGYRGTFDEVVAHERKLNARRADRERAAASAKDAKLQQRGATWAGAVAASASAEKGPEVTREVVEAEEKVWRVSGKAGVW